MSARLAAVVKLLYKLKYIKYYDQYRFRLLVGDVFVDVGKRERGARPPSNPILVLFTYHSLYVVYRGIQTLSTTSSTRVEGCLWSY